MAAWQQESETAAQLFARLGKKQSLDGLDSLFLKAIPTGICPGDSVELYGAEGSGKTALLVHFCVKCILPKKWGELDLSGKEAKVIYIDTDYKFPLWRVVKVLENHLRNAYRNNLNGKEVNCFNACEANDFVKSCLDRLFIFRCYSSCNLAKTLGFVESVIHRNPDICILIIDSISAFYWVDKTVGGANRMPQEANQRDIVVKLKKLQDAFHIVVMASKSAIMNPSYLASNSVKNAANSNISWKHDMYMSQEWTKFVKYRYLLRQDHSSESTFSAILLEDPSLKECKFAITDTGLEVF